MDKDKWELADRKRRLELQEDRVLRAFSAPTALLPQSIAGQHSGAPGDFSRPRECGEGDPANFSDVEKALIADMLAIDRSKATAPERKVLEHLRRVGHPYFQ